MDIVFRWISISRVTYLTYELKYKHFINTNHTRIHVLISMATNVLMSIFSDQTMLSSTWSKHSFSEEHLITWLRIIFSEREVHITRFLGKTPWTTQGYCVQLDVAAALISNRSSWCEGWVKITELPQWLRNASLVPMQLRAMHTTNKCRSSMKNVCMYVNICMIHICMMAAMPSDQCNSKQTNIK